MSDLTLYVIVLGVLAATCLLLASWIVHYTHKHYCRYCRTSRLPSNLLEVQPGSYICRKCAKEKKDYVAFRGVDLENFCYTKEERGIPHKGSVTCFDNDIGHFKVEDRNGD